MQNCLWKKGLVLGIILLFVGAGIIPSVGGTVVEKESNHPISDGNTLYVGGSGEGNYTSIQDAINNACEGDTVFVYDDSSPYYENVKVNYLINLIGENRETTIIDGSNNGTVVRTASWVNISGFTIRNSGNSEDDVGIFLWGANFCNISGNIIALNNGSGIWLWGEFKFPCTNNIISGNIITSNKYNGIQLCAYWNTIKDNTISDNGNGIYTYSGTINEPCMENIISDNTIASNNDNGIENVDSWDNIIYHNNFIKNGENAQDYSNNVWDNGYPSGGNFWSDYIGTDSDGDGIGDTPYPILGGNNEDKYPLGNFKPNKPIITGPNSGKLNTQYDFTFNSTDPESDDIVEYIIDWGDTGEETISGPFNSGEEAFANHSWDEKGSYTIQAKAKDVYGAECSAWGSFVISIPRNRATTFNPLLYWFLERFPLLEKLLNLLK